MDFLVVGGVWFWIITAMIFAILVWEVSWERNVMAGVTIISYLILIHLFGNASIFSIVREHPAYAYIGIPLFFVLGALWSVVKWWFFIKQSVLDYKQLRMNYLAEHIKNVTLDTPMPDSLKSSWNQDSLEKPIARRYKKKIMSWMIWWPFSMFWTLVDEPWRLIYEAMIGLFQKISDRLYSDIIETDFVQINEAKCWHETRVVKHDLNIEKK